MPVRRVHRVIEMGLAVTLLLVVWLAIFSRLGLGPWALRPGAGPLVVLFLLAALRVWTRRERSREDPPLPLRRRLTPGLWLDDLRLPGLVVLACGLFVLHTYQHHGGRLSSDGVMNFVYVRSMVVDGDFDFTNEFRDFVPEKFQVIAELSRAAGRPPDPSNEPGPALLWAPLYAATHGLVGILRLGGSTIPADGYGYPYVNAVSLASVLYAFVAVAVAYRVAARFYPELLSAVAVSGLWLSSTLFWYTVVEPTMPHAATAAVGSVFVWAWLEARDRPTSLRWMVVGLMGGLLLSMQRYAAFFFVAPALTLAGLAIPRLRAGGRGRSLPKPKSLALAGSAVLLAALPMLAYNYLHSGGRTLIRAGDLGGMALRHWAEPRVAELLFSTHHGLFAWTPAAYVAVLGLVIFVAKSRGVGLPLIATLACGLYLLGSTWDWHAGSSFGSRRLTEAFAIFAIGFTAAADLVVRRPFLLAGACLGALVAGNFLLADLVRRDALEMQGTVDFAELATPAAERLYEVIGHPPSMPAPLWFARRYGVSPRQFDRVFGHRSYSNLAVEVGLSDEHVLGRGWSRPEVSADGARFRWSEGASSSWLVSLFDPFRYRVRLTGSASRHPDGRALPVALFVNGAAAGSVAFTPELQSVERIVEAELWRRGLNEIELRYGWTVEAGEAYGGEDDRRIALRLERLELTIEK